VRARLTAGLGLVLMVVLGLMWPSTASAQASGLCKEPLFNNVDPDDDSELQAVMDSLADRGANVHVLLMSESPTGVDTPDEVLDELLKPECPELLNENGTVKDNVLVVYAIDAVGGDTDAFDYNVIAGKEWSRYATSTQLEDSSDNAYFDRHYVDGTTAFLKDVEQRAKGFPWKTVVFIFIGVLVLVIIGVLVFVLMQKQGRSKRKTALADRARNVSTSWSDLHTAQEATAAEVTLWTQMLSDEDKRELVEQNEAVTLAVNDVSAAFQNDKLVDLVMAANSHDELDQAERDLEVVEAQLAGGQTAQAEVRRICDELTQQQDDFRGNQTQAEQLLASLPTLLTQQEQNGFKVDGYRTTATTLTDLAAQATTSFNDEAFPTAHRQITSVIDGATKLAAELEGLPERAANIDAHASKLAVEITDTRGEVERAATELQQLQSTYNAGCTQDVANGGASASTALQTAHDNVTSARAAVTSQDFPAADRLLSEATPSLGEAQAWIQAVRTRAAELRELQGSLPTDVAKLVAKAQQVKAKVDGYGSDVDGGVRQQAEQFVVQARDLQLQTQQSQPDLLGIAKQVTATDDALDELSQTAQTQYDNAQPDYSSGSYGGYGGTTIFVDDDDDFGRGGFGWPSSRSSSRRRSDDPRPSSRRGGGSLAGRIARSIPSRPSRSAGRSRSSDSGRSRSRSSDTGRSRSRSSGRRRSR
jgi:hypothetical protein